MNYVLAPLYKRAISYFIDLFAISLLVMLSIYSLNPDFASSFHSSSSTLTEVQKAEYQQSFSSLYHLILLIYVPFYLFYQTFFIYYMGATLGKYLTKSKCISLDQGKNPSLKASFIRAALRLLSDSYLLYIGFLFAFFNPLKQTLHDKISKTVVVNVK